MQNQYVMDRPPTPEQHPVAETPAPPSRHKRGKARASRREEFLALFRDTTGPPAPPTSPLEVANEPALPAVEPSLYLRRFRQLGALVAQVAPSGLAALDHRLAGGFGPGLHVARGQPGIGKTAFLESVAWEAVSSKRPVLYYALKDGELGAWQRLIHTLGFIIGDATIPFDALRAHALAPHELELLARLDVSLQAAVLPYLSLVGSIPARTETLSALIGDIRLRVQEVGERHGKIPLLLIDDLEHVLPASRERPLPPMLARLDDVLATDSTPGLLTMTTPDSFPGSPERLPVRAVLTLTSASTSTTEATKRVDLELDHAGRTRTLPLLLDRSSGLFAEP